MLNNIFEESVYIFLYEGPTVVTTYKRDLWAIPRKPQPKVLNRYPQIWPIFIYVIEGWILWILAKADSKNIEPFGFYRIFTESTRKCTFSTDDFATHKK